MELLPKSLLDAVPPLYSQEEEEDPQVVGKFFTPWAGWTWYLIELDKDPESPTFARLCFGLVDGLEVELGYFDLVELQAQRGPGGLMIERDLYWRPRALSQVRAEVDRRRGAA